MHVSMFNSDRTVAAMSVVAALLIAVAGFGSAGLSQYMMHSADDEGLPADVEYAAGGLGSLAGGATAGTLALGTCAATAPACVAAGGMAVGAIA